jgi:hypothetical protein
MPRMMTIPIGERFGKLVILKEVDSTKKFNRGYNTNIRNVECLCDCGNTIVLQYSTLKKVLKRGSVSSCGCQRKKSIDIEGFEFDKKLSSLPIEEKREIIKNMIIDGCSNTQIINKLGTYGSLISEIRSEIGMKCFNKTKEYPIGKKFNLLTVVGVTDLDKNSKRKIICVCDCGKENVLVRYSRLIDGTTKSCGCYMKSISKHMMINTLIPNNKIHGDSRVSKHKYIYDIWLGAKQRCYNPNNKRYSTYGKLGITMYDEWINNYPLFKEYILTNLGERPVGKSNNKVDCYSIDRIDVTKGYEPENLRWATFIEQANNKHKS